MENLIIYAGTKCRNSYRLRVLKKKEFYEALEGCQDAKISEDEFRKLLAQWESEGLIKILPMKFTIISANRYCG